MVSPVSPPIHFNYAQSFYLDAETVKGAKSVGISSIELFFKQKPNPTNNKSNIVNPGVTLFICETNVNKEPIVDPIVFGNLAYEVARLDYDDIAVSSDASRPTKFKFPNPVVVETNKEYCIIVRFDGNEDFILWTSKQNDILVGTNKPSPGPSGKYTGNYYERTYVYVPPPAGMNAPQIQTPDWKFLSDTDLKFRVYVARYAINGNLVGNSTVSSTLPANTQLYSGTQGSNNAKVVHGSNAVQFHLSTGYYEYVIYDKKKSKTDVKGGEFVYQNTVFYPGGSQNGVTVSVTRGSLLITANSQWPNGQNFNWNSVYGSSNNAEYIVLVSLNDDASGKRRTDVKQVVSIESNTVLRVDTAVNFTNSAAYFIKSPVARVDFRDKSKSFDVKFKQDGKTKKTKQDLLVLNFSNANVSHRFVNNTINSISVSANGSGYNNSDVLFVYGFENSANVKGGYPAIANIVTNGTGNITAVYLSNVGCGFVNTANVYYIIANSSNFSTTTNTSSNSGNPTPGTGGAFTLTTGTVLRAEFDGDDKKGGYFTDCGIINIQISDVIPYVDINNPAGTKYDCFIHAPYYSVMDSNTYLGVTYFVDGDANKNRKMIKLFETNGLPFKNTPVLPSRSNEFIIVDPGTGNSNNEPPPGSNVTVNAVSNNDFVCIQPKDMTISYSKFNINNDYTDENTNYGNADSKHITTKIVFANERFAEDLLVYLTAYRPINTDIKVFARIHNSKDPEAFDDKDWTMLELREGNTYSSSAKTDDYVEMTFGFQQHPNVAFTLAGTANVENTTTTNVVGSGTSFSSNVIANVQVNDLVKIYSPLFPENHAIRVVTAVDSDTQFRINKPIDNTGINGSGLKIDFIGRLGNTTTQGIGYPLQAYNDRLNDNVVRYYSSSMSEYDTYDSMQLKIVLLADVDQKIEYNANTIPTNLPRVDDIRAVGVTA